MKIAVLSDIHGNLEAFEAVLKDVDNSAADILVSLGDNVGYGPEPEQIVEILIQRKIPSVLGNHEHALLDPDHIDAFNPYAKASILITRNLLSEKSMAYIATLPRFIVMGGCRFVHGVPPDSPTRYIHYVRSDMLNRLFSAYAEPVCFVGHTHKLDLILFDGQNAVHKPLSKGPFKLDRTSRYIINSGSVGQPRDGDNHAKYVIWDTEEYLLDIRYVDYDIARVVEKIRASDLPLANAYRLL